MRDRFDIIVIGGGHNGLVAASELAGTGLSVCTVEARERVGGCAITTEPLLPRFRHNPHANSFLFADIMPEEIAPSTLGVGLVQPDAQFGIAFADGRPPLILHRPELLDATRASLSVYSSQDAANYSEIKRRSASLGAVLKEGLYSAPKQTWFSEQRRSVLKAMGRFCRKDVLGKWTARQWIDSVFRTPEVRMLLYALALETGVALEEPGGDVAFLGYSLWIAGRWRMPMGGMQVYSDALVDRAKQSGVEMAVATPARQILVENGRAAGIRTADGRELHARVAVVASVPIMTLYEDLLLPDLISRKERDEVRAFRQSRAPSIGTSAFCLDWTPRYKSGLHDGQIDRCLKTVIGFNSPEDIVELTRDVSRGLLPRPAGTVRVQSLWDDTLAPAGCHIAAIDSSLPGLDDLDSKAWRQVEGAFPLALYETWQHHLIDAQEAPPMTMAQDDALGFERRMLLRMGNDQYRTSVPGLYLAGPGVYPGGGVHGACGRNAASVILGDHASRP